MTNNQAYWRNRANRRMDEYLNIADSATQELAKAYAQATAYLADEAKRTFSNFAIGIAEPEARRLLSTIDTADTTAQVKLMLAAVTDPALKRALEKQLAVPAYRARLLRLKSLQEQVDQTVQKLGTIELQTTTQGYVDTATHAYYRTAYDTQKAVGVFDFAQLQHGRIEEITAQNWSGKHYSERIWGNMGKLADELQRELVLGFATGRSSGKMARVMADKFDVAYWKAARLARTETNYVANQAEMETYKACGFERYKFLAKLDSRTSKLCQKQDGKVYAVEDAQAGINLPPLHPYCRSTTVPVIPGASIGQRIALGENGKSIKVPANMTYAEWRAKYVDNKGESGIIEVRGGDGVSGAEMKRNYKIFNKIDNTAAYSTEYKSKLKETYLYFKDEGFEFTEHALGRTIGQKTGKGKHGFENEDALVVLKQSPNFVQEDGKLVRFYNDLAIIQAPDTNEIVSIVVKNKARSDWKEIE